MLPRSRLAAPQRRRLRPRGAPPLLLAAALALAGPAAAQPGVPEALRGAPPELDESRPGGDPASPPRNRSDGPTGDDVLEDREGGGIGRGVIRPPAGVDPGIQGTAPEPAPGTTPVIPPPGTPGGDPGPVPR